MRPSSAALGVFALALVLAFYNLGETSLPSFDDAFHAQTAKEMLRRGEPITITYGGRVSFESSPLLLWFTALSYAAFGISEHSARLPVALFGFATVVLVYAYGRRRWGEAAATAAAFILAATPMFARYTRHVMMEAPLAFFVTAALFCLSAAAADKRWYLGFGAATGLAVLTKSAMGLLPLIIAPIYLVSSGKSRELVRPRFLLSLLPALLVLSVWYVPALVMHGQAFIDSHIGSYLAVHTFQGHHEEMGMQGLFYYLIWLPINYLPWTIALAPALVWGIKDWKTNSGIPLLWLMVVVPVVILSLITTKYTRYLMPIFPAAALLIAATCVRRLPGKWSERMSTGLGLFATAAACAVLILPISLDFDRNAAIKELAPEIKKLVPEGGSAANLGLDFYEYQNPLFFYADRRLDPPLDDPGLLWSSLPEGGERYGLASSSFYEELLSGREAGMEAAVVRGTDELVFFKVKRLGRADWEREVEELASLIEVLEKSERLGCYSLPYDTLRPIVARITGKKLLPSENKARQMVRAMAERSDTVTGLAWSGAFDELLNIPRGLPRVVRLAATDNLVLFRLEGLPGGGD
jgi:hypothetical protein